MKLFVGLDVSPEVSSELEQIQEQLRRLDPNGKYENMDNFHLTLRYIGEYGDVEAVIAHLEPIEYERFELHLNELGMFDNPDQNVVWVNVREENEALQKLQRLIDLKLISMGVQVNRLPFVPHISLAYDCQPTIRDDFSSYEITPLYFEVTSFHLYAVDSSQEGSRFRKLKSFQLV